MGDRGALVHNMSAPPKTVVKYSGLAGLADTPEPANCAGRGGANGVFGTPVRFALPAALAGQSPAQILRHLGVDPEADPEQKLSGLINARANELPLPDGCAVIPTLDGHRLVWADALSALAILAKCSDSIWLRAKSPAINAALVRQKATLLVPPLFATRLPEACT